MRVKSMKNLLPKPRTPYQILEWRARTPKGVGDLGRKPASQMLKELPEVAEEAGVTEEDVRRRYSLAKENHEGIAAAVAIESKRRKGQIVLIESAKSPPTASAPYQILERSTRWREGFEARQDTLRPSRKTEPETSMCLRQFPVPTGKVDRRSGKCLRSLRSGSAAGTGRRQSKTFDGRNPPLSAVSGSTSTPVFGMESDKDSQGDSEAFHQLKCMTFVPVGRLISKNRCPNPKVADPCRFPSALTDTGSLSVSREEWSHKSKASHLENCPDEFLQTVPKSSAPYQILEWNTRSWRGGEVESKWKDAPSILSPFSWDRYQTFMAVFQTGPAPFTPGPLLPFARDVSSRRVSELSGMKISKSYLQGDRENNGRDKCIRTPSFDNVLERDTEPGANHNAPEYIVVVDDDDNDDVLADVDNEIRKIASHRQGWEHYKLSLLPQFNDNIYPSDVDSVLKFIRVLPCGMNTKGDAGRKQVTDHLTWKCQRCLQGNCSDCRWLRETVAILGTKRVSTKKPQDKGVDTKSVQHQPSPTRSNSVASSGPPSLVSVSDTESIDDSDETTIPHTVMVKFTNEKIKQLFFEATAEPFGNKPPRTSWKTDFANAIGRAVGEAVEEAIRPVVLEMKKGRRDTNINHQSGVSSRRDGMGMRGLEWHSR
ncbi:hypothetical protein LXA43DRAFT_1067730 [Ganoderma leucocontextum]|nr:hypothetical protein LXA43DRAFT_1067730 [Ganoderma leucocontextum]